MGCLTCKGYEIGGWCRFYSKKTSPSEGNDCKYSNGDRTCSNCKSFHNNNWCNYNKMYTSPDNSCSYFN